MHRTDPLYVAISIVFAVVVLVALLRRLRTSLPGQQTDALSGSVQPGASNETNDDDDQPFP